MTTPPFPYFGGKASIAARIVDLFPAHDHYVEPFAGSLAVLLAKPRSNAETVNDLDGDLMTFWRVLRDQPDELATFCEMTPHARVEHSAAYDRSDCTDLERARRVWVCLTQGRSGSLLRTGWRYQTSTATSQAIADRLATSVRRMPAAAKRLAGVTLESGTALEVINRYGATPSTLLYVDPPYFGGTRGENGRERYQCDMPGQEAHVELLEALLGCRASVVLSGYNHPLYAEHLQGWHVAEMAAIANGGGGRVEVLWSNRPLGQQASLFNEAAS